MKRFPWYSVLVALVPAASLYASLPGAIDGVIEHAADAAPAARLLGAG